MENQTFLLIEKNTRVSKVIEPRNNLIVFRVPTDTGKPGKPGKMEQLFPVREKSGNFEKMSKSQGKVREF